MTTVAGVDLDLIALRDGLTARGVVVRGELTAIPILGGRSNVTIKITDAANTWVLRRPPVAGLTPSAHDVSREFRVVQALQGSAVPVAQTILDCPDSTLMGWPFTLVQFVSGRTFQARRDLDPLSGNEIRTMHEELLRVLVEIHSFPYADVGLADFGRPEGYLERQLRRWRRQWDLVATRELGSVDRLYAKLVGRLPRPQRATLVHGDFRVDNVLFDSLRADQIRAVVDWEMSTLGDPLTDVATFCVYRHPAFDHVVGEAAASTSRVWPDSVAQTYARLTGADLAEFPMYLGLAYFKLAVIAEGIAARRMAGAGEGPGFATAHLAVPLLLEAGLQVTAGRE
jgi:aminoglycoside phosphotransferase (APT) family kinase protein